MSNITSFHHPKSSYTVLKKSQKLYLNHRSFQIKEKKIQDNRFLYYLSLYYLNRIKTECYNNLTFEKANCKFINLLI